MHPRFLVSLVAVGLLVAAADAQADTVTLVSSRDNTLYENTLGLQSNGSGQYFFVGRTAVGANRRGVLRFSVEDSIPFGSAITSVSLQLYMSRTTAGPVPIHVSRLLKDWGEGASDADFEEGGGATSEPGDATWIHTFYDSLNPQFWMAPGGDFSTTIGATQSVDSIVGFYTWPSTPDLVRDVQSWVNSPSTNFGWILRVIGGGAGTAKRFNTREDTTDAFRPRAIITFLLPQDASGVPGSAGVETAVRLEPNTPNPFGARTTLAFELARGGPTRLSIHDAEGRRLVTLLDGIQTAGRHVVVWDGRDESGAAVASGVYLTRLESAGETRSRAIHLLR